MTGSSRPPCPPRPQAGELHRSSLRPSRRPSEQHHARRHPQQHQPHHPSGHRPHRTSLARVGHYGPDSGSPDMYTHPQALRVPVVAQGAARHALPSLVYRAASRAEGNLMLERAPAKPIPTPPPPLPNTTPPSGSSGHWESHSAAECTPTGPALMDPPSCSPGTDGPSSSSMKMASSSLRRRAA